MILITGGSSQGKYAFARSFLKDAVNATIIDGQDMDIDKDTDIDRDIDKDTDKDIDKDINSDAEQDTQIECGYCLCRKKMDLIRHYHLYLRRRMQQGADEEQLLQETKAFCEKNPDVIVVTEEVGCGVVPMDAFERKWREVCGRASVILAERSEQVYRVICGIPQRLK